MSVTFSDCEICGRNFCDGQGEPHCCLCGRRYCSDKCSEEHKLEWDDDEDGCLCKYCRSEDVEDSVLLKFCLKQLEKTRKQVLKEYLTR